LLNCGKHQTFNIIIVMSHPPNFSICVYLGSRDGNQPAFAYAAGEVGRWIGQHGGQLVYGGGNNGLMGILAQATLDAGGRVLGIIPQALVEKEWAKTDCTELRVVQTMHERKAQMAENADAFLALPGGIGTFEELFEAWTWKQLGYHSKPIGILNVNGCYDPFMALMHDTVANGFVGDYQMEMIQVAEEPAGLLRDLVTQAGLGEQLKRID
jgi:uncharacterized protein (TIGR00730 family)